MKKISKSMSIQKRLITLFLSTSLIIAAVNIAIIANIRYAFSQIDNIYMSNVEINDLSSSLDNVQSSLTDYLNTKSTESLENFYKYSQSYSEKLGEFSRDIRTRNCGLASSSPAGAGMDSRIVCKSGCRSELSSPGVLWLTPVLALVYRIGNSI